MCFVRTHAVQLVVVGKACCLEKARRGTDRLESCFSAALLFSGEVPPGLPLRACACPLIATVPARRADEMPPVCACQPANT